MPAVFHCSRCGQPTTAGFRLGRPRHTDGDSPFVCGPCLRPGEEADPAGGREYLVWALAHGRVAALSILSTVDASRRAALRSRRGRLVSLQAVRDTERRRRAALLQAAEAAILLGGLWGSLVAAGLPAEALECRELEERLRRCTAA